MRRSITWMMVAILIAGLVPAARAAVPPDGVSRSRLIRLQRAVKRKSRRPKKRVTAFGVCHGTSIVTAIDEVGNPLFPTSIVPVTSDSFVFSTNRPRFLQSPVEQVRVLLLGEDPPMATIANDGVGNIVFDDAGIGSFVGTSGQTIVSCTISAGGCTVLRDLGRPIEDLAAAGNGAFAVITRNEIGNPVTALITPDGGQVPLMTVSDAPGFFPQALAVKDGTVFVGGFRSLGTPELTAVVISVSVNGGLIREVAELGQADEDHLFTFDVTAEDRPPTARPSRATWCASTSERRGSRSRPRRSRSTCPTTSSRPWTSPRSGRSSSWSTAGCASSSTASTGQTLEPMFSGRILRVCP